jgi:predicted Zn-dependent peptidase
MRTNYKSIDESIFNKTTSSGLPVYMIKNEYTGTFHMALMVNFGGIDLSYINLKNKKYKKLMPGTAHFLEHKLFESEDNSVFEKFSKQNASVNAYTNLTSTVYYFSCTDNIEENIKLFLHILQNPYITDENVEKEKGIIEQEISMYSDNPSWRVYSNFLKSIYKNNYVKYEIAGTHDDIQRITSEDLLGCYEDFYVSDNMAVFTVGNIDEEGIFNLIDSQWNRSRGIKNICRIFPHEPQKVVRDYTLHEMDVSDKNFLMGFKGLCTGITGKNLLKREVILNMLLEYLVGSISTVYESLYDKNYIDNSFSYGVNTHKQFIFNLIGGVSREPEAVKEAIVNEILRVSKEGISSTSFETIKRMLLGNFIRIFDNDFALLNNLISYRNKGINLFDIFDEIKSIKIEELQGCVVELFNPKLFSMSVVAPKTNK